jgi:REP element-mobilizing transposase RayT
MGSRARQLSLGIHIRSGWGGRRRGAGRKPRGAIAGVSHRPRMGVCARHPMHVTLRVRKHVWNLRSRRSFRVLETALRTVRQRVGFRVAHFSVQGNHVHLLVEASDRVSLAAGIKSMAIRAARGLNSMMGSRGSVFADRYHSRDLRTPTEVRRALAYVLCNYQSHALRRGDKVPTSFVDHFGSSYPGNRELVAQPHTWLLQTGWRRAPTDGERPPQSGRAPPPRVAARDPTQRDPAGFGRQQPPRNHDWAAR